MPVGIALTVGEKSSAEEAIGMAISKQQVALVRPPVIFKKEALTL